MDGDFKGDFTRDNFDPFKRFSRVLMQQGRVLLDADWNEQVDMLLRYLRTLAGDLIGPFGGPVGGGFEITVPTPPQAGDFTISSGDYYVDGILVEIPPVDEQGQPIPTTYKNQPYNPQPEDLPASGEASRLVYLDVWELQVSFIQDDTIREVALGVNGPDTATRALVVWQVKTLDASGFSDILQRIQGAPDIATKIQAIKDLAVALKARFVPQNRGLLRARAKVDATDTTDVCITPPDALYRGAENQLYRVEIHNGGTAGPSSDTPGTPRTRKGSGTKAPASGGGSLTGATFKWSREDGSVVFPIVNIDGKLITLANLGRDEHLGLEKDDWVEVIDDDYTLQILGNPAVQPGNPTVQPFPLLRVDVVDPLNLTVTLSDAPQIQNPFDATKHPLLRRWDQKPRASKTGGPPDPFDPATGTVNIVESAGESEEDDDWITLEDSVQIQFPHRPDPPHPNDPAAMYRPGDYWLIPARTIIGDVEWPQKPDPAGKLPSVAVSLSPHGVEHHYAPLAGIALANGTVTGNPIPLLLRFKTLVELSNP